MGMHSSFCSMLSVIPKVALALKRIRDVLTGHSREPGEVCEALKRMVGLLRMCDLVMVMVIVMDGWMGQQLLRAAQPQQAACCTTH